LHLNAQVLVEIEPELIKIQNRPKQDRPQYWVPHRDKKNTHSELC